MGSGHRFETMMTSVVHNILLNLIGYYLKCQIIWLKTISFTKSFRIVTDVGPILLSQNIVLEFIRFGKTFKELPLLFENLGPQIFCANLSVSLWYAPQTTESSHFLQKTLADNCSKYDAVSECTAQSHCTYQTVRSIERKCNYGYQPTTQCHPCPNMHFRNIIHLLRAQIIMVPFRNRAPAWSVSHLENPIN